MVFIHSDIIKSEKERKYTRARRRQGTQLCIQRFVSCHFQKAFLRYEWVSATNQCDNGTGVGCYKG